MQGICERDCAARGHVEIQHEDEHRQTELHELKTRREIRDDSSKKSHLLREETKKPKSKSSNDF